MHRFERVLSQVLHGTLPLGFLLRNAFKDRWVRFHSLPQAKRYPEKPDETETVLERMNALASWLLEDTEPVWLVHCKFAARESPLERKIQTGDRTLSFVTAFEDPDLFGPDECWSVYAGETRWNSGSADDLLGAIAQDEVFGVTWISEKTGAIFAPYDGGADCFPETAERTAELKRTFPNWLSRRADGL
ncbi:DUF3885 domain-containing protein [Roseibium sp. Sym1]|uniref:DUF3885 domain-containing protein n=1 Tax=Roseibium sp. Sym1 TaxID=3016006 RepID=UPI0022B5CD2D|nr:hypothetical protein [Roseibium sp. Sym1]